MAKILILIGAHLCTAPRPQKEAEALAAAGHDVIVRGLWYDPLYAERDAELTLGRKWRFEPVVDFRRNSFAGRGRSLWVRARGRAAREKFARSGKFTPSLLGYGAGAMLKSALSEGADLTVVHSEAGLWVGGHLLDRGLRVGVDFEDWFSEDLPPDARRARPVEHLKRFESRLMRECSYRLTTSQALSAALAAAYEASRPAVVYNAFPFAERAKIDGETRDRRDVTLPSLHWFSQTIGPGRGLETLFESLRYISSPAEIHLRGNCSEDTARWITSRIPEGWRGNVFIHTTVNNSSLLSRIAEHDIGLALEVDDIPSRNLTVTNKLFQYMQAGLAVIATNTAGQLEVLKGCPDAGLLVETGNPQSFARAVEKLLVSKEALAKAKGASLRAARDFFSWESQEDVLLRQAEKALSLPRPDAVPTTRQLYAES